ncbi:hypothetical protein SDC9_102633 [bioreactor metagenome]|uniref:Uncharacterized protein n=1 Tax=bioreactor metagenome TaxID=1076179 RepID=A0A645ASF5_9ZZZZ
MQKMYKNEGGDNIIDNKVLSSFGLKTIRMSVTKQLHAFPVHRMV